MGFDFDSSSNSNDSTTSKEENYNQTFIQNTVRDMDQLYDAMKPSSVRVTRLKPESEYWTYTDSQQKTQSTNE